MMGWEPRNRRLVHDTVHMLLTLSATTLREGVEDSSQGPDYGADLLSSLQIHSLPVAHGSGPFMPWLG